MSAPDQELTKLLETPRISAKARQHFKRSKKTLEEILAELEEENSTAPLVNSNSPLYKAFMTLLQNYYKEERSIILNLQIFNQNQPKLEKIYTLDLKPIRTLNSDRRYDEEKEKDFTPQENQTLWERLRNLQNEIRELQQQQQEAEQELEKIENAREKIDQQIEAVKRLTTDKEKPRVHTEQIKDIAIAQDVLDKGINLKPSRFKKLSANPEAELTDFNKQKVALDKKSAAILRKDDLIQTQLSEKQQSFNGILTNPACNSFQLTPYSPIPRANTPTPRPTPTAKKDLQEERIYLERPTWQNEGAESAKAARMEAGNEAASPRPSLGKQA